ncbi:MAG TPA: ATP-binding protein [Chloroflexota bacterium]
MNESNEGRLRRLLEDAAPSVSDETTRAELSPAAGAFIDELITRLRRLGGHDFRKHLITQHLACPQEDQTTVEATFAMYKLPLICRAVQAVLDERAIIRKVCQASREGFRPPVFRDVEVEPSRKASVPIAALYLVEVGATPAVVEVDFDDDYEPQGRVEVIVPEPDRETASALLDEIERWAKRHNFYRGKKLEVQPKGGLTFLKGMNVTWDDVILPPEVTQEVKDNVIGLLTKRALYQQNGLPCRRGVLLEGPPGVGKTLLLKALANAVDCTVLWVTPKAVESPYSVTNVYEMARELAPTVVIWEDLDLIGRRRGEGAQPDGILGELLSQMDGVDPNEGIITCASTNEARSLDVALSERPARFDRTIAIGLPGRDERRRMLERFTRDVHRQFDAEELVGRTAGLSGAAIAELVFTASMQAIDRGSVAEDGKVVLTADDFQRAFAKVYRPTRRIGFV